MASWSLQWVPAAPSSSQWHPVASEGSIGPDGGEGVGYRSTVFQGTRAGRLSQGSC